MQQYSSLVFKDSSEVVEAGRAALELPTSPAKEAVSQLTRDSSGIGFADPTFPDTTCPDTPFPEGQIAKGPLPDEMLSPFFAHSTFTVSSQNTFYSGKVQLTVLPPIKLRMLAITRRSF